MSRPTKQGVDYFPVDVQFDDKLELLIADKGAEGLGILITIWQLIYQNEGYYIHNGEDLFLLVRRRILSDVDTIREVIESAIKRGVFDQDKHKAYKILTSKAIQKRYFLASVKKKNVRVVKNYLCEGVSAGGNATYLEIDSRGNATNVKEKEKEKEEVKEVNSLHTLSAYIRNNYPNVSKLESQLTYEECERLVKDFPNTLIKEILDAMENKADLRKKYKSVNLTIRNWIKLREKNNPQKEEGKVIEHRT